MDAAETRLFQNKIKIAVKLSSRRWIGSERLISANKFYHITKVIAKAPQRIRVGGANFVKITNIFFEMSSSKKTP